MMEQQEVKNFSSFSKSLTLWASFVNRSSIPAYLPVCLSSSRNHHDTEVSGPLTRSSYWTDPSLAASSQCTEVHWISKLSSP